MQISLRQDHSIELICLEKLVFVQFVGDTLLLGDRFEHEASRGRFEWLMRPEYERWARRNFLP